MLKNVKLRVKILLVLFIISLVAAGVVGGIAYTLGVATLKEESFKKLTAVREMKANQVENYFDMIFDQVRSFSESITVVEATLELKNKLYSEAHQKYQHLFKNYLDLFGYDDIFLVDAGTGVIIYTVSEKLDPATNILDGPFRNTGVSNVFREVIRSDDPDCVCIEDFLPFPPSDNALASFIASPVYNGKDKIGVLIFQLSIAKINNIMTDGYEWDHVGLGKTGETYLVGNDYLMRNQSRFLVEDSENFFKALEKTDISRETISKIKTLNSTIGLLPIVTRGTQMAMKGESGTRMFSDYRGTDVLSAYKPLSLQGLNWVILSEIDKSEAFAAIHLLFKRFTFWFVVLLLVILVFSFFFTRSISNPLRILTLKASNLAKGNLDDAIKLEQNDEMGILAENFELMRISVKKLVDDLQDINLNLEQKVNLRTSELNLAKEASEAILDKSPVPVAVVDAATASYLRVNDAMTEFHKLNSSELLKRSTLETYANPEQDRPVIMEMLKVSGRIENLDVISKRIGTGEERRTLINVHPISYFGKEVYITSLIDITERKMMEEELKTQSAAMESAENAIIITNPQGLIQWVNPSFTTLTGYTPEEALGSKTGMLKSGEHDEKFYSEIWGTIHSGEVWRGEIINRKKNGDLYHEEMTITPVTDAEDNIVQFVAIKQDITERKRLEELVIQAKERMEEELNVAREIQMSMLPLIFPAFPERRDIDIYAKLIPAREVGGDFYDFYFLDESHLCFVVGDVSGKGVSAALLMAVTRALLKSQAGTGKSTAGILTHVNNEIAKDNEASMFITVFMAILNTTTGELVYSNAGHNPSLIIDQDNGVVTKLADLSGPVVGIMEDVTYTESRIIIETGNMILVYTDGVPESQNKDEEMFTEARLVELLRKGGYDSAKKLTDKVIEEVKSFEEGAGQFDDITVLAVQYCV